MAKHYRDMKSILEYVLEDSDEEPDLGIVIGNMKRRIYHFLLTQTILLQKLLKCKGLMPDAKTPTFLL